MDRVRFSYIAHRHHDFCNPISGAKMDRAAALLGLRQGATVLDIGAGKCELAIRLIERYGARVTAVERYALFADEGRERAKRRVTPGMLRIEERDAAEFLREEAAGLSGLANSATPSYDAAACVGATYALGGLRPALESLKRVVRPGGRLLIGEAYWKKPPAPEYLAAIGGSESECLTHAGNVELAEELGLTPLWATTASEEEWDEYEWLYARSVEEFAAANPDDLDRPAMRERIRKWRRGYLRWGRETMGFGVYVFRAATGERL